MVKPPKSSRVAARYVTVRVDFIYWGRAYDQGAVRFPEADVKSKDLLELREMCRNNINRSYSGNSSK